MPLLTSKQIETDMYLHLRSAFKNKISGAVYRGSDSRPTDSILEDVVVKYLTGTDGVIQRGTVLLNIYVPKILDNSGKYVENQKRIDELESYFYTVLSLWNFKDYYFWTDTTINNYSVDDINQSCIVARIEYRRVSL